MQRIGRHENIIDDDEDLESIEQEKRELLQNKVYVDLNNRNYNAIMIDGHLIVHTPKGFVPGLRSDLINNFKLDGIVLLTATPDDIVLRRQKAIEKYEKLPNWDNLDYIDLHQQFIISSVLYFSLASNIPFNIVVNESEKKEKTVNTIVGLLEEYIPGLKSKIGRINLKMQYQLLTLPEIRLKWSISIYKPHFF
jgi:adenylate kinase